MTSVRTVWAVTSGSYSDYMVHCLFETEDLAKAYAKPMHADVEPFQLWSALPINDEERVTQRGAWVGPDGKQAESIPDIHAGRWDPDFTYERMERIQRDPATGEKVEPLP